MNRKDIPIPDMTEMRRRRSGARSYPIDLSAPENKERPVDVRLHGIAGANYYYREDNPPYDHRAPAAIPELFVREGVLLRLQEVNVALAPDGLEVYLFDAYRPVLLQNYFHDEWVPGYLRKKYPAWTEEEIQHEVGNYWARGAADHTKIDPLSPPPHATGGVVDLTLRSLASGEELPMGGAFDDVSPVSFVDHFEKEGGLRTLTENENEARRNRRILYAAMTAAGFTVNPNEWWHYGFGDQLSSSILRAPFAVYSVMQVDQ